MGNKLELTLKHKFVQNGAHQKDPVLIGFGKINILVRGDDNGDEESSDTITTLRYWIQRKMGVMMGLFDRVGLRANMEKMVVMVF